MSLHHLPHFDNFSKTCCGDTNYFQNKSTSEYLVNKKWHFKIQDSLLSCCKTTTQRHYDGMLQFLGGRGGCRLNMPPHCSPKQALIKATQTITKSVSGSTEPLRPCAPPSSFSLWYLILTNLHQRCHYLVKCSRITPMTICTHLFVNVAL